MDNAVERYRVASESNDIDALMQALSDDVELISPLSARMVFRGHKDMRRLLESVYGSVRGFRWNEEVGDGHVCVVIGEGRVGPFRLADAMVFELAADGRIRRIRPHLRPYLGLTWFALTLAAKLARHPAVLLRALRRR